MTPRDRIHGFPVLVLDGREVSPTSKEAQSPDVVRKVNGPHVDARFAQDLLGTYRTSREVRAATLARWQAERSGPFRSASVMSPHETRRHRQRRPSTSRFLFQRHENDDS